VAVETYPTCRSNPTGSSNVIPRVALPNTWAANATASGIGSLLTCSMMATSINVDSDREIPTPTTTAAVNSGPVRRPERVVGRRIMLLHPVSGRAPRVGVSHRIDPVGGYGVKSGHH